MKFYNTSNHIERLNKELKRRSKVIGVFPNEDSVLRLMGSVLIELHDAMDQIIVQTDGTMEFRFLNGSEAAF